VADALERIAVALERAVDGGGPAAEEGAAPPEGESPCAHPLTARVDLGAMGGREEEWECVTMKGGCGYRHHGANGAMVPKV